MICLHCNKTAEWLIKDLEYDKRYPTCSEHIKYSLTETSRVFTLVRLEKGEVAA
jgi:hypothetical protein